MHARRYGDRLLRAIIDGNTKKIPVASIPPHYRMDDPFGARNYSWLMFEARS